MTAAFEGWAMVELLGHRVRYGRVSEVTMFGETMLRLEIPTEPPTEEFYSGKALYGIRPATEEHVRAYNKTRPALSSGEVVIDDDEWSSPGWPFCSGCGEPLGAEATVNASEVAGQSELWHERCVVAQMVPSAEPHDDAPVDHAELGAGDA